MKKTRLFLGLGLVGVIFILVGIFYPRYLNETIKREIIANTFQVEYLNKKGQLTLASEKPINDFEVYQTEGTNVRITNLRDKEAMYQIKLKLNGKNTIDYKNIKVSYRKNGGEYTIPEYISNLGKDFILLDNQKIDSNTSDTYDFFIWISDTVKKSSNKDFFEASLIIEKIELSEEEAKDMTPPQIILNEPVTMKINQGDSFTDPGISKIYDEQDGIIDISQVTVRYEFFDGDKKVPVPEISTNQPGVYYLYYLVKDKANNESIAIRTVVVNPQGDNSEQPIIPELPELKVDIEYSITEKTKEDVIVTIHSNQPLQPISGWDLSMDQLTLTKSFSTNINSQLLVVAANGQSTVVTINIQNIDKTDSGSPTPTLPPTPTPGMITVRADFGTITTNSVEIIATPSNSSRVKEYYYSCNGNWSNATKNAKHTCDGLNQNTLYTFQVKVVDKDGRESLSSKITIKTLQLEDPTFQTEPNSSIWAKSRKVTILYPKKQSHYQYQYKILTDENWKTLENETEVTIELHNNQTIVARVTDGKNEVAANYVEKKIDRQAPIVSNPNLNVQNVTLNSAQLLWELASDNSTSQQDLTYYVCQSTNNDLTAENCKGTYNLNTGGTKNLSQFQVNNLNPSTTYYFGVLVVDQFGYETFYQVKKQTTLSPTPTPKPPVQGRLDIANMTDLVGINYSIWFDYMQNNTGGSIYNISNILAGNGSFGPVGKFHYWGQPRLGYYRSTDKAVIRQHMIWLADAGVDFIILDNTNPRVHWIGSDVLSPSSLFNQIVIAPTKALLDTIVEMRQEGIKTPYVLNWMNTDDGWTLTDVFQNIFYNHYDEQNLAALGYNKAAYRDIFVHWYGLPFMLTTTDMSKTPNSKNDLNYRKMWGLQTSVNNGEWSYLQRDNRQNKGTNYNGTLEQMSVSVAMQQNRMSNTSSALGRRGGLTFYQQWYNAFQIHPKIITLTWWNEWGAERIDSSQPACGQYCFTDNYNQEYSRDIEPMSGGHGDKYYQWMKQYIKAYKNHQSCPKLTD